MPQWAGSSWYWLRYTDPTNDKEFASKEALDYWSPVDLYVGEPNTPSYTSCTPVSGTRSSTTLAWYQLRNRS